MILGDGFLADGIRAAFGDDQLFTWVAYHPALPWPLILPNEPTLVVISTPIRLGTIARLEADYPSHRFAYVPENVREAHPEDWTTQARFIIGTRSVSDYATIADYFSGTCCIPMLPEEAELTKHALNGFLALSILYAGEIAAIARHYHLDPEKVAEGLLSDPRIKAPLRPVGVPSEHLWREVLNLLSVSDSDLIHSMGRYRP